MKRLLPFGMLALLTLSCSEIPGPAAEGVPVLQSVTPLDGFEVLWGPMELVRTDGPPNIYTLTITSEDFQHFEAPFVLYVQNGNRDGTERIKGESDLGLISSATVVLDGVEIFGRAHFSQQVPELSAQIQAHEGSSLVVTLASRPGSGLIIWIEGTLRPGRARIDAEGGTVRSPSGDWALEIDSGTLESPTIISMVPDSSLRPAVVAPGISLGPIFKLGPDTLVFDKPVRLKVLQVPEGWDPELVFIEEYFPETQYTAWVPNFRDSVTGLPEAELRHFSWWTNDIRTLPERDNPYTYGVIDPMPAEASPTDPCDRECILFDASLAIGQWAYFLSNKNIRFVSTQNSLPDIEIRVLTSDDAYAVYDPLTREDWWCRTFDENCDFFSGSRGRQLTNVATGRRAIVLNAGNSWASLPYRAETQMTDSYTIHDAVAHEFGHSLGLWRETGNDVMGASFNNNAPVTLRCSDLNELARLYAITTQAGYPLSERCAVNLTVTPSQSGEQGEVTTSIAPYPPAVLATDIRGLPVGAVPVLFSVVAGDGVLQRPVTATGLSGEPATAGNWSITLGNNSAVVKTKMGNLVQRHFYVTRLSGGSDLCTSQIAADDFLGTTIGSLWEIARPSGSSSYGWSTGNGLLTGTWPASDALSANAVILLREPVIASGSDRWEALTTVEPTDYRSQVTPIVYKDGNNWLQFEFRTYDQLIYIDGYSTNPSRRIEIRVQNAVPVDRQSTVGIRKRGDYYDALVDGEVRYSLYAPESGFQGRVGLSAYVRMSYDQFALCSAN